MTHKTILSFISITILSLLAAWGALAHVKWFTDRDPTKDTIENIISPLFILTALLTAVLLALLTQVVPMMRRLKRLQQMDRQLDRLRSYSFLILKYGAAAALLIQVTTGSIFAPEFATAGYQFTLLWITIALLLIPHHWATKLGAVMILGMVVDLTIQAGLFHMLDYGFYAAIAGALLLEKTSIQKLSFPLLYLGTGLSLCWVAAEKWVYPVMAIDVIEVHTVPTFGFSPAAFVVLAAFIEFVVGYLLVVGILNRILAIVLTLIFVSTTMLFGMTELIGHFMIHIVLIIFIIEGVSFYKPPVEMHDRRIDQVIFVSLNFLFVLAAFLLIYYRFA